MSALDTQTTIEVGDFIKAIGTGVSGIVLRPDVIGGRTLKVYGWRIDAGSREDFIDSESAVLIAKHEAWWERLAGEVHAGTTQE